MRVTEKTMNTIIDATAKISDKAFNPRFGSNYDGTGFRVAHAGTGRFAGSDIVWSSGKGGAVQAAAFYLGVIEAYRRNFGASPVPDELADIAQGVMAREGADEWHAKGKDAAEHAIKIATEDDKRIIRDKTRPIEDRRAAFKRHNRRGNPRYADAPAAPAPVVDNTPLTGGARATHLVASWLNHDSAMLSERVGEVAKGNEFEYGDVELAALVSDLLYDAAYGRTRDDLSSVTEMGGDIEQAKYLRESITRDDFDAINWAEVRILLIDDEDE